MTDPSPAPATRATPEEIVLSVDQVGELTKEFSAIDCEHLKGFLAKLKLLDLCRDWMKLRARGAAYADELRELRAAHAAAVAEVERLRGELAELKSEQMVWQAEMNAANGEGAAAVAEQAASDGLPPLIVHGPDMTMPVVQRPLGGKLGCLDTGRDEIAIEQDQPKAGKHLILLHELIHLVAEHLKEQGITKRQPDEKFVTNLAGGLFPILALSGLWNGVTTAECEEFLAATQQHAALTPVSANPADAAAKERIRARLVREFGELRDSLRRGRPQPFCTCEHDDAGGLVTDDPQCLIHHPVSANPADEEAKP